MSKEFILHELKKGENSYYRAGNVFRDVCLRNKDIICGEDALLVFNTYGISPRDIKIIFYTHGFEIDDDRFAILLAEQEARITKLAPR